MAFVRPSEGISPRSVLWRFGRCLQATQIFLLHVYGPTAVDSLDIQAESGPMIYIAHEMTPFSPADVTIYSNCEEVRLTVFQGGKTYVYKKESRAGMPSPVIVFKDVYRFMDDKSTFPKRKTR